MKQSKKCRKSPKKKKNSERGRKIRKNTTETSIEQCPLRHMPLILSPHNTTQYLIENNSSPFYLDDEEPEEYDLNLSLNPFMSLESKITSFNSFNEEESIFKDLPFFNELASTAANSQEFTKLKLPIE